MSRQPIATPTVTADDLSFLGITENPTVNEFADVPQQLKSESRWVAWANKKIDGRMTKLPFNVLTGNGADSTNPSDWATFEQALDAFQKSKGRYDGIGFVLGDGFCGFDFDACLHDDKPDSYTTSILEVLGNPYCKTSPSGTGLKTIFRGELPPDHGNVFRNGGTHTGIEIYSRARYFAITGRHFSGPAEITTVTPERAALAYILVTRVSDKKNQRFKMLWLADLSNHDGDASIGDFALACELAKLTKSDATKIEWVFGFSALGKRDKWLERKDYRERTIKAAIAENPVPGAEPVASSPAKNKIKMSYDEIQYTSPARLGQKGEYVIGPAEGQFDGWFPLRDISLVGGASGTGKTTFIFEALHKQKEGYPVLGHATFKRSFHVLAYDRGQDAFERTMRRLNLLPSDVPTTPLPIAFGPAAIQGIINEIEKMSPIPNIIFIEGLDMVLDDTNKKSTVTPFMRQLQGVAEHFHIALIGSLGSPKTKRGEGYAAKRDQLCGSEAWGRNCETVMIFEFSEEDDGSSPRRELSVLPRNAPAEMFSY
jgi:hypothetical protein